MILAAVTCKWGNGTETSHPTSLAGYVLQLFRKLKLYNKKQHQCKHAQSTRTAMNTRENNNNVNNIRAMRFREHCISNRAGLGLFPGAQQGDGVTLYYPLFLKPVRVEMLWQIQLLNAETLRSLAHCLPASCFWHIASPSVCGYLTLACQRHHRSKPLTATANYAKQPDILWAYRRLPSFPRRWENMHSRPRLTVRAAKISQTQRGGSGRSFVGQPKTLSPRCCLMKGHNTSVAFHRSLPWRPQFKLGLPRAAEENSTVWGRRSYIHE